MVLNKVMWLLLNENLCKQRDSHIVIVVNMGLTIDLKVNACHVYIFTME